MRYKSVVFDFFGTLTVATSSQRRAAAVEAVARTIGAPPEEFRTMWWGAWPERAIGGMGDFAAAVRAIAARLGLEPTAEALASALAVRLRHEREFRTLRDDAITTLQWLRDAGIGTALVSDCTDELPAEWDDCPAAPYIQVPVFSYIAGVKKPDPRIYAIACEGLEVSPADCLFVGDGGSNELEGASAAGMTAVRIMEDGQHHRFEQVTWEGPQITTLSEIPALIR